MSFLPRQQRNTFGLRAICARCGGDLEYHGAGKWYDRGGNTHCHLPADTERLHRGARHTPTLTHTMLVRRSYYRIEVGHVRNRRPGYRWVQGWEVQDPQTRRWSTAMRYHEALNYAAQLLAEFNARHPT